MNRLAAATVLSIAAGIAIALVDASPGYDATGLTAVALFATAGLATLIAPTRPWLWAVLVGAWTPAIEVLRDGNGGAALALVFAGAGSLVALAVVRLRPGSVR